DMFDPAAASAAARMRDMFDPAAASAAARMRDMFDSPAVSARMRDLFDDSALPIKGDVVAQEDPDPSPDQTEPDK
ncbi:MAG: hypothetical protein QME79_14065, partial [Bacillota bacterium]|nr:hypothetical protein [Bacillota bacterium]